MSQTIRDRVCIDYQDNIALVRLARADKYNALDLAMLHGLVEAAAVVRKNRSLRAVVLHGEGKAFCAGLDFASVMRKPAGILRAFIPGWRKDNLFQRAGLAWRDLPVPVIGALHGYCFGGGMQLALGCDIRFSSPDCQFSIMEIEWGLIPDMSASVTLRDLLPLDSAMELTLTGRKVDGDEAQQLGLVSHLADDPLAAALSLAKDIANRSPDAIVASKKLLTSSRHIRERRALARERRLQLRLLLGSNAGEARQARLQKRPAQFHDR